ncbi:MAG: 23S rRNA (guanosine(2251)-2'-O)-methyltransferase RlmB [Micavibrio aeruginosavorus]|uniref:23S rRNA (Guanosine(2251)-2'-O)-methyltransferase RlmB n=1 Tax=Micavibrio aeruginosavorus TaxID=349221 RepID=A0A7T5UH55_9BACT|nr:MAG: 23S rRNA (guanosine(2251)-2'-O)-methyltransferase RlmB [Micavibrio aeruginosavorus]
MAREFGNKGGKGGKPAGRSGGKSGGFGRTGGARSRDDKPKRSYGDRDNHPTRGEREERPRRPYSERDDRPPRASARSYGEERPKRAYSDRDDKPRRSYGEDRPKRAYSDRDDKPRRSYSERGDKPKRSYADRDRDSRPPRRDSGERAGTPRRYMRDESETPRKPKRDAKARPASQGKYAARKPFKGRFADDAPAAPAPRERKTRIGAETLSGSTSTPRVRIQANLWGQHAVKAAWLNPARTISALYTTPEELKLFAPVMEEARTAGIHRPEPTLVGREDLDKHLPRDAVHQGVAATAAEPEEVFIQDIINRGKNKNRSLVVILDQVTDPHNVGAIIRSVCALGGDGVVMQRRNAPELTGVVAKAACGAVEHVMVAYETNLSRTIEALQTEGYTVAGLDERGEQTVDSLKGIERLALVLGSEGPGLRHLVKEHCDVLVKIRMDGPIPSLNVSNAAAVALYAAVA